jgi:Fur family iron response transcriptional regulator
MRQDEIIIRAANKLRQVGLRPTRQRMALARLLFEDGDRHVTAEQLHDDAMRDGIRVSLATIYNTLNQFTDAGLLQQVVVDTTRSYFDTNVTEHHHFLNEDSGELLDIPSGSVDLDNLPAVPVGTKVAKIDVIVRLRNTN